MPKGKKNDNVDDFFQLDIKDGMIPNSLTLRGVLTHIRVSGIVKLLKKKDDGHGLVDYKKIVPFIIPYDFTIDEMTSEIIMHCYTGDSRYKSICLAKLNIDAVYTINGGSMAVNLITHNGNAYVTLDGKSVINDAEKGMIDDLEALDTLKFIDGKEHDLGDYWGEDPEEFDDDYSEDDEDY